MIAALQISLIFFSHRYCHSESDSLFNVELLTIYHLLSTVSREIGSQEISPQWLLNINIHEWREWRTFTITGDAWRKWTQSTFTFQTHSTYFRSSIMLYLSLLTCIHICVGRTDAHEAAGHPTAGRGCLTLSHWLYRDNPPHGRGNSWWWSWSAVVSPHGPQLGGGKKKKRK